MAGSSQDPSEENFERLAIGLLDTAVTNLHALIARVPTRQRPHEHALRINALHKTWEYLQGTSVLLAAVRRAEIMAEMAANKADVLGAILHKGKEVAVLPTLGIIDTTDTAAGRKLGALAPKVREFGIHQDGPLDLAHIQHCLDQVGKGYSFVDRRTPAALAYRARHQAGTLFPSPSEAMPPITERLIIDLARVSDVVRMARRFIDAEVIEVFNAAHTKTPWPEVDEP
jgi:hypothetical protein